MSEDNTNNTEQPVQDPTENVNLEEKAIEILAEDLNNKDLSKFDQLPDYLKKLIPKSTLKNPWYRQGLSGRFKIKEKKPATSWYNNKLILSEEFDKLSWEDRHTWLNKITRSSKRPS